MNVIERAKLRLTIRAQIKNYPLEVLYILSGEVNQKILDFYNDKGKNNEKRN